MPQDKREQWQRFAERLYDNQESIHTVLKQLDIKWKLGEEIQDELDTILNRYEELMLFVYYLVFSDSSLKKEKVINDADLNREQIEFFDSLVRQYQSLEPVFIDFIRKTRGIENHLTRIRKEGSFYDPDNQVVQAAFSLYTNDRKLMQVRDDVDDFIWLAEGLIEMTNTALEQCKEQSSPLSKDYIDILNQRFDSLDEDYQKLQDLIRTLKSGKPSSGGGYSIPDEDFGAAG